MKTKLGQILLIAIVGLIGVLSVDAQQMNLDGFNYVGNTLENGRSLKQGEGIKSPNGKYVAVLQKDGNFCLYRLDAKNANRGNFIKCTMTVGAEDKKGAALNMQQAISRCITQKTLISGQLTLIAGAMTNRAGV